MSPCQREIENGEFAYVAGIYNPLLLQLFLQFLVLQTQEFLADGSGFAHVAQGAEQVALALQILGNPHLGILQVFVNKVSD